MFIDSKMKVKSFFISAVWCCSRTKIRQPASSLIQDKLTTRGQNQPFSYIIVWRETSGPSCFTSSTFSVTWIDWSSAHHKWPWWQQFASLSSKSLSWGHERSLLFICLKGGKQPMETSKGASKSAHHTRTNDMACCFVDLLFYNLLTMCSYMVIYRW